MPNIKQQKKRVRIAAHQRLENLRYRSTIKTLTRRLASAVEDGDADAVARAPRARAWIDRAAARGALHKNTAARKKRRRRSSPPAGRLAPRDRRLLRGRRDLDERALELELAGQPAAALEGVERGQADGRVPSSSGEKLRAWANASRT